MGFWVLSIFESGKRNHRTRRGKQRNALGKILESQCCFTLCFTKVSGEGRLQISHMWNLVSRSQHHYSSPGMRIKGIVTAVPVQMTDTSLRDTHPAPQLKQRPCSHRCPLSPTTLQTWATLLPFFQTPPPSKIQGFMRIRSWVFFFF